MGAISSHAHRAVNIYLRILRRLCIPGTTEPDVAVRVAGGVVQIQRLDTRIAAIVPIPAAQKTNRPLSGRTPPLIQSYRLRHA